jgi:hypothetical protein
VVPCAHPSSILFVAIYVIVVAETATFGRLSLFELLCYRTGNKCLIAFEIYCWLFVNVHCLGLYGTVADKFVCKLD